MCVYVSDLAVSLLLESAQLVLNFVSDLNNIYPGTSVRGGELKFRPNHSLFLHLEALAQSIAVRRHLCMSVVGSALQTALKQLFDVEQKEVKRGTKIRNRIKQLPLAEHYYFL